MGTIHNNYMTLSEEDKRHVDEMYRLIANYGKEFGLHMRGDDRAEALVEAIATHIVVSRIP